VKRAQRAVVLQHTPTEGPERVAIALAARGIAIEVRAVYGGDAVPEDLARDEVLIVMGGPMGVGDAGSPQYPFLDAELALLRKLIGREAPVLGICLGAQLLAAAAGARVYPMTRPAPNGAREPAREVGWGPVDFVASAAEPLLAGLGRQELMLHWHGDTFDLPVGATLLASTPLCPHQAFRLGARQIALQFHCELEAESIPVWVREDAEFVRGANGPDGGARILRDTARLYATALPAWDRLLGNVVDVLTS
jgi:GMP synthase-like glutamine amidotransferase